MVKLPKRGLYCINVTKNTLGHVKVLSGILQPGFFVIYPIGTAINALTGTWDSNPAYVFFVVLTIFHLLDIF